MEKIFFITCIVGTENVVVNFLKKDIKYIKINKILSGAIIVILKPNQNINFQNFYYINNVYKILYYEANNNLEQFINKIITMQKISINNKKVKTFRVFISDKNKLIKCTKLNIINTIIHKKTNLTQSSFNPDLEFLILKRSENICLFMQRSFKHKSYDKILEKGQLRPDLCNLLVRLSEPSENDIIIEPFFGSGSIIIERIRTAKYNMIFANEIDPKKHILLKSKYKNIQKKIIFKNTDSTNLTFINDLFINKIITDPPWGEYNKNIEIKVFYTKMINEFVRILSLNGIMVIITACKDIMDNIIYNRKELHLVEKLDILVSGKKASIYKIKKIRNLSI